MTPPVQVPFLNCSLKKAPLGQQLPQQLLQMSAQDHGCAGLRFKVCSTDEGLNTDAEVPGVIPSSAAVLQRLHPFKKEVVFPQGYPAWRRAESFIWVIIVTHHYEQKQVEILRKYRTSIFETSKASEPFAGCHNLDFKLLFPGTDMLHSVLVRTGTAERVPKLHHKQVAETREKSVLKISHPLLNQTICTPSKPGNPSFINPDLQSRILHVILVVQAVLLRVNSFIPPTAAWQLQPHPTQPDAARDRWGRSCRSTRVPALSTARSMPPSSLFAGSSSPESQLLCSTDSSGQG